MPCPERLHVTPFPDGSFETVTVRAMGWPCKMVCELPPLKLTEIAGGAGLMVTVATANLVVSAADVAVTITLTVLATLAGASYWTDVPDCLLKVPWPERLQVTPFPEESLETFTVRVTDWPCKMVCELPPVKLIEIAGVGEGEAGALALEPQPERIAAVRNPAAIRAIRVTFFMTHPREAPINWELADLWSIRHLPRNSLPISLSRDGYSPVSVGNKRLSLL